jgi:hypothetical protein
LIAGVAKLANARDLKSRDRKVLWVQFPPPALKAIRRKSKFSIEEIDDRINESLEAEEIKND